MGEGNDDRFNIMNPNNPTYQAEQRKDKVIAKIGVHETRTFNNVCTFLQQFAKHYEIKSGQYDIVFPILKELRNVIDDGYGIYNRE